MANQGPRVSVVICTKNRSRDLSECLDSLSHMTEKPDELVIIDNNSVDDTSTVIQSYAKRVAFPVRHVIEHGRGYPTIYNRGVNEARYPWIAFIDDDCVADVLWLSAIKKAIRQSPGAAAVLGRSDTYYGKNIYSLATLFNLEYWKSNKIQGTTVVDCEVLDNKNIVYNRVFLSRHTIAFDERRIRLRGGAAEDCDLGMQIARAGGSAVYSKQMLVHHKDPIYFRQYVTKTVRSYLAYATYEQKWKTFRQTHIQKAKNPHAIAAAFRFASHKGLRSFKTLLFIGVLYAGYTVKNAVAAWRYIQGEL